MVFPTQSKKGHLVRNRKWEWLITELIKRVVADNLKNNVRFSIWKPFWSNYIEVFGKSQCDLEISNKALKSQAKFLSIFDPKNVSNIILLRQVDFYQLKQCHIAQGLNLELQNLPSASSSPLKLNTPIDTCSQLHLLLMCLYVCKSVAM
jgi:hypothetical protein